jgi:hypothetical protein
MHLVMQSGNLMILLVSSAGLALRAPSLGLSSGRLLAYTLFWYSPLAEQFLSDLLAFYSIPVSIGGTVLLLFATYTYWTVSLRQSRMALGEAMKKAQEIFPREKGNS